MEISYGTIPLKKNGTYKVFLVKLRSGDHWGFPKGHPDEKEDSKMTAIRELSEETNLTCKKFLTDTPFKEHYQYQKDAKTIDKTVYYYLIEAQGEVKLQDGEILDGRWFTFEEASQKITFSEGKILLEKVKVFLERLG